MAEGAQAARTAVIFTCSYGEGHRSAQQAMEEMLKAFQGLQRLW